MTVGEEALAAVVARIDERTLQLVQRFDAYTETETVMRADIALSKEEARREITNVRVDLERQIMAVAADLDKHEAAVNPHPQQEDWLRRSTDRLTTEIGLLRGDINSIRTEFTTAKGALTGAGKVLYPLVGAALGIATGLLTHALGG